MIIWCQGYVKKLPTFRAFCPAIHDPSLATVLHVWVLALSAKCCQHCKITIEKSGAEGQHALKVGIIMLSWNSLDIRCKKLENSSKVWNYGVQWQKICQQLDRNVFTHRIEKNFTHIDSVNWNRLKIHTLFRISLIYCLHNISIQIVVACSLIGNCVCIGLINTINQ